MATTTAWARLSRASWVMVRLRWVLTVASPMNSCSAISVSDSPRVRQARAADAGRDGPPEPFHPFVPG